MQNKITYILLFLLLFFTTGCLKSKAIPQLETSPKIEPKIIETNTSKELPKPSNKDKSFKAENYVKDSKSSRVLIDCFQTGKSRLNSSCKKKIKIFLQDTPKKNKKNIIIQVHTDKAGSAKGNMYISQKRARNVAASLISSEYKNAKVYYHGMGESKPLYDATNKKANHLNRRIVFLIQPAKRTINIKDYSLYKPATKKKYVKKRQKKKSVKKKKKVIPVVMHKPKKKKLSKVKKHKSVQKTSYVNIKKYSGQPDIGWMYFGNPILKHKLRL